MDQIDLDEARRIIAAQAASLAALAEGDDAKKAATLKTCAEAVSLVAFGPQGGAYLYSGEYHYVAHSGENRSLRHAAGFTSPHPRDVEPLPQSVFVSEKRGTTPNEA